MCSGSKTLASPQANLRRYEPGVRQGSSGLNMAKGSRASGVAVDAGVGGRLSGCPGSGENVPSDGVGVYGKQSWRSLLTLTCSASSSSWAKMPNPPSF